MKSTKNNKLVAITGKTDRPSLSIRTVSNPIELLQDTDPRHDRDKTSRSFAVWLQNHHQQLARIAAGWGELIAKVISHTKSRTTWPQLSNGGFCGTASQGDTNSGLLLFCGLLRWRPSFTLRETLMCRVSILRVFHNRKTVVHLLALNSWHFTSYFHPKGFLEEA